MLYSLPESSHHAERENIIDSTSQFVFHVRIKTDNTNMIRDSNDASLIAITTFAFPSDIEQISPCEFYNLLLSFTTFCVHKK